jgi:hypothetical protein
MLHPADLEVLIDLPPIVFDGWTVPDIEKIYNNNLKQELKKGGKRTPLQIKSDTAKGIGFEQLMIETGLFVASAPVVDNADKDLKYSERQTDLFYGSDIVQAKTVSRLYGDQFYLKDSQYRSVRASLRFNNFFLFGSAEIEGNRDEGTTLFTYAPIFCIDTSLLDLITRTPSSSGAYSLDRLLSKFPQKFQPIKSTLREI